MRLLGFGGAALTLALLAGESRADQVSGTRSVLLVETSHEIRVVLAPTHANLRVRRQVFNGGDRHDQAEFRIELPRSSVAVGLATLGLQNGRPFWFTGELMEAEAAAAKYQELTGIGGYYPKDPALLSWRSQSELALQVFPCAPKASKWIEYTLEMPTQYADGRYFIELPRTGTDKLSALASITTEDPADRLFVRGVHQPRGTSVRLDSEEPLRIELESHAPPRFAGELATMDFTQGRALTRFRVAAAPHISSVPKQARIVVVLDGSVSVDVDARLGAIAAARAYLSHFPDAQAEVVVFDRKLHPRHGRLVPSARAQQDLGQLSISPENGSDLDRALVYADTLLAREPANLPKRVLVLTDARTRTSLSPDALSAALSTSGALLHIGVVQPGELSLMRDDEHPWARVTRPTGGLVWVATARGGLDPNEERNVFEEWARPKALDHASLTPSLEELQDGYSLGVTGELGEARYDDVTRFVEGEARDVLGVSPSALAFAELRGELWATPVALKFAPDEKATTRWAAMVFGSRLLDHLSEPEMMVLARRGGAVSPVTSYLAVEPGVRPSTEGLEWGGFGEGIGLGDTSCLGWGRSPSRKPAFDQQKYLEDEVKTLLTQCGAAGRSLALELETTYAEIVDLTRFELDGADFAASHCVREAVWDLQLPAAFDSATASFRIRT